MCVCIARQVTEHLVCVFDRQVTEHLVCVFDWQVTEHLVCVFGRQVTEHLVCVFDWPGRRCYSDVCQWRHAGTMSR